MSFSDPSGYAGAPATLRTIEEIVVTANRRPAFPFPPLHFFAIPDPNQVTLDELANLQSIIDVLTRYLDISALLAATEAAKAVPPKDKDKGKDQGNDEAEGKDKSKPQPALPPCAPSPDQLALSGPVTFRFSQGSATVSRGRAGPTSGDVLGTFKTASGYSGTFHTYFDGAFYGTKGFGVSYGTGSSNNLSTFKGVNYNIIGTLGPYSISDNFDPDTLKHVGQTDEFSKLGLGIGVTRSKTFLYTITCPKK